MNLQNVMLGRRSFGNGSFTPDLAALALVPPRLALGGAMVFHGRSKLSGEGAEQTGQFFESLGLRPGRALARATGWAEVLAGTLAVLGVGTRLAALAVLGTQLVAVSKVHAPKGYDVMQGGYEYNLALMAMALGLLLRGPGEVSLHERLEHLVEGRAPRRLLRRRRPSALLRALRLLK